ncbi:AAA family ATPase [Alkalinema sp. FACHB-956]|uniref:AAA family ATPase n=1 Tax=Alkalinema sp. FACHB-956 TaxID=2692768 RepID=UPI001F5528F5|nr:AAA family ATPase [Alkalinema sp. FACHB-956]
MALPTLCPSMQARVHELQTLILSFHPLIVFETVEEERVQGLLQAATQEMGRTLMEWSITQGLTRSSVSVDNRWQNDCAPSSQPTAYDNSHEPLEVLKRIQELNLSAIFWLKDFAVYLEDATVARQFRELVQTFSQSRSAIILTGNSVTLPQEVTHEAVYYDLKLPARDELHQAVMATVRSLRAKNRVQIEIQDNEIQTLVQALSGMTLQQARKVVAYAALEDGKLTVQDIDRVLNRKAQVIREESMLEYFPVDHAPLQWGGFAGLKQWLNQAKVGFSPQAREWNLQPPKGILIVGIQGCGKSLAAKAIAKAWKMPLLKLDAGRLYDKYVGESEKNFRNALSLAESMAPAVLWIDEIEKSFGTSNSDSDGGLSQRMFGSFLTWMQEKSQEVFVIATANDLSKIPPELLRKGRFDEIFFVDLPDAQERATILQLHLVRRKQDPAQFDFNALVAATDGFSGAEIEQAIVTALYKALYLNQPLRTELIVESVKSTVPLSVSRREDVNRLRTIARERFVSVR